LHLVLGISSCYFKLAETNCSIMKKFCLVLMIFLGVGVYSHAQTTPAQTSPTKAKAKKPATATTAGPTKKDGTADMRYKSNKDAKAQPATVHTKKDGTPDKRYKENK
jgi:hypothetical protein